MSRFVGLDVHKRVVQACILDLTGSVLAEVRFELTPQTLLQFAQAHLGPDCAVALEATTNTWAVVALLKPLVGSVVVSNPLQTRAIAQAKVKTDKVDAHVLAQLLRADFLPTVWQPDEATQVLRRLCSRRASLVGDRTAVMNRLHSTLAMRLLQGPTELFGKAGRVWLGGLQLDNDGRAAIDSDLRLLDRLDLEIAQLDAELVRRGYQDDRLKLLLTLPGVDVTAAQALLAALGDVHRFSCADQAASYLGLVPSTRQSAAKCYHGPITKAGNAQARCTLIQAAQHLRLHPGPLGAFFRKLAKKKNHNVAVVATARKLVVIAWHMLTKGEPYRYAQPRSTETKLSRLRVRATGQKRRTGPAQGTPQAARTGQRTRRVKPLAEVYEGEGLPLPLTPSEGERRAVSESGTQEFVAGLQTERRIPRSAARRKENAAAAEEPGAS
jgi:transposase